MRARRAGVAGAIQAAAILAGLAPSPAAAGEAAGARTVPQATEGLRGCAGGGFLLPGSATCLRMSGAVSTTMALRSGTGAAAGTSARTRLFSSQVEGRVAADLRVPTEVGPLRAYLAIRGRTGRLEGGVP